MPIITSVGRRAVERVAEELEVSREEVLHHRDGLVVEHPEDAVARQACAASWGARASWPRGRARAAVTPPKWRGRWRGTRAVDPRARHVELSRLAWPRRFLSSVEPASGSRVFFFARFFDKKVSPP